MRYLTSFIQKDLSRKLVFLAGARQVGKSTLAKSVVKSNSFLFNWDIPSDRKIILDRSWPKDASLIVFDELHKYLKWKNFLKGVIDEYQNDPPVLVTGSARLETFRKGGDALTGRTYLYRLHPIDPIEAKNFFGEKAILQTSKKLLKTGGFPEAFLNPKDANRLREDRMQIVVREDIRDLSMVQELRGIQLLIELLRDRVGGTVNYSNLANDVGVSPPTIKKWVELLEKLYIIYLVYPFTRNLARSIRREPKVFFYDVAAAVNGEGAKFENLIGSTFLKYIDFFNDTQGTRYGLSYFRDKDEREVDFVITDGLKPKLCLEAKLSDDSPSKGLLYFKNRFPEVDAFQIIGAEAKKRNYKGIDILSINEIGNILENLGEINPSKPL